ncbi:bacillithiol system redox-active protein YtxJ [Microbacteriaceae bacterium 4G12]
MSKVKIETVEQLEKMLAEHPTFLLFKHSLTCPISQRAYNEFQAYEETVPTFYLYVQEARPLSTAIAERLAIRHESPQALYVKNGAVVWHASHSNITKQSLESNIH